MIEYPIIFMILYTLLYGHQFLFSILIAIYGVITTLLYIPLSLGPAITSRSPVKVFYTLMLGGYVFNSDTGFYEFKSTNGWVDTFGLNGIRIFQNQPLWGHLPLFPLCNNLYHFPGIFGFTGIQIILKERMVHLGSALWIEIGSEPPGYSINR